METVENQATSGATITLDGKHFVHCHFQRCRLIYGGGDCLFTETRIEDCEVAFTGAAQRTVHLLGTFGALAAGSPFFPVAPSPAGVQ